MVDVGASASTGSQPTLYYCHDPMCSYCYAFEDTWAQLRRSLPSDLRVDYLVGGLASDSEEAMPQDMQLKLQEVWRHIHNSFGKPFNFDFWTLQQPRRATYDACRAALVARRYNIEQKMIEAIQQAYYLGAKNPSNLDTLADCSQAVGLDRSQFLQQMSSDELNEKLRTDIGMSRQLGLNSFPSLLLEAGGKYSPIAIDYADATAMLDQILRALNT